MRTFHALTTLEGTDGRGTEVRRSWGEWGSRRRADGEDLRLVMRTVRLSTMPEDEIRQLRSDEILDGEIAEEWVRETSEPQIRDLGAWRCPDDDWRVTVSVAEFIYGDDEPLLSEFLEAIETALRSVKGVSDVVQEDQEQWIAYGTPSGEHLVRSLAVVVDALADKTRSHVANVRVGASQRPAERPALWPPLRGST